MKKLITTLLIIVLSLSAFGFSYAKQPKTNNLISIQFKVSLIKNGTYYAFPIKPNKDKEQVIFSKSDIKGKTPIVEGQIINAIYKKTNQSEDQFLYVTPTNKYSYVYKIVETHKDYVTVIYPSDPNTAIDFYYDDMIHKQKLNVNDYIAAFFYKDKAGNFHIIDWNKTI